MAIVLSDELFKEWENWSSYVNDLEMKGGAGKTIGAKDLGQVGKESQQLTEDDPYPRTVYRVTIKKGNPLLVTVPLRFNLPAPSTQKSK